MMIMTKIGKKGVDPLKVETLLKIYFIILSNQVFSRHKGENHVKISFIVLCNQIWAI